MSHITACLNCSATIDNGPFCEQCGQRNVHVRLHFADLVRDVKDQLFEWDLPWLFTIREMALRPGQVCREYMDGKRRRYVNPLKYVFYLVPVILVVLGLLPERFGVLPQLAPTMDVANYEHLPLLQRFLANNPVVLAALLAPLFALLFRIVYVRHQYNNTEISCFILFSIGNCLLGAALVHIAFELYFEYVAGLAQASPAYFEYFLVKIVSIGALGFLHTVYAASVFFKEPWYLSWLKIFAILSAYGGAFFFVFQAVTGADANAPARRDSNEETHSELVAPYSWIDLDRFESAGTNATGMLSGTTGSAAYGQFLLMAGRSADALYYLLRASQESSENPNFAQSVAAELALAYLYQEQYEFAQTQTARFDTPFLRQLRIEAAMQRGDREGLPALISASGLLVEYNSELAQLWGGDDIDGALALIRTSVTAPRVPGNQVAFSSRWAALLGDPRLAWALFMDLADKRQLWRSIWMPYYSEVRKLPAFKLFVRDEGLENYWRTTAHWPERCRPLGDDDFECF